MTQPEVGQRWQNNTIRAWVVGLKRNGIAVCEFECGTLGTVHPNSDWVLLPDCTGWDWEPEPEEPADDWLILDPVIYADHVPRDGVDEFYDCKQWRDHTQRHVRSTVGEFAAVSISSRVRCRRSHMPALPVTPTTRTIKLCSVVYWDRPEAPMSTILTEQELERHRKAWRVMHVVSESTVEVPL